MADSVENTGLDCQFFETREEAEQAAVAVNAMYTEAGAEVFESVQPVTITFQAWNEHGW